MKKIFLFFFSTLAFAQQPTNIFVGKLSCAARQVSADEIQCWCRQTTTNRVVVNELVVITPKRVFQWYYSDNAFGETDAQIIWMFWTPDLWPGQLAWQAVVTIGIKEGHIMNGVFPLPGSAPAAQSVGK